MSEKVKCGIIIPLSEIDGCSAAHWQEVLAVVKEALAETSFEPEIVSNADESGVIQKRIVTNLYENPIAICDVSAKNPNVMFELGMRLAFDKPTVVIKDDRTAYSFDTSPIEHVPYPRDLHYQSIVTFKSQLRAKVEATYRLSQTDKEYSCFLKHFIRYEAKSIPTQELPASELILKRIEELSQQIEKKSDPERTASMHLGQWNLSDISRFGNHRLFQVWGDESALDAFSRKVPSVLFVRREYMGRGENKCTFAISSADFNPSLIKHVSDKLGLETSIREEDYLE